MARSSLKEDRAFSFCTGFICAVANQEDQQATSTCGNQSSHILEFLWDMPDFRWKLLTVGNHVLTSWYQSMCSVLFFITLAVSSPMRRVPHPKTDFPKPGKTAGYEKRQSIVSPTMWRP